MSQWLLAPIDWPYWQPRLTWFALGGIASSFAWITVLIERARAHREMRRIWRARELNRNLPQEFESPQAGKTGQKGLN